MVEIDINKFRFPTEVVFATDAEDFLSQSKSLFRLKSLNKRQQFVEPLSYGVDNVDKILISHIIDSVAKPELDAGSLNGIAAPDNGIGEFVPYGFVFDEYRLNGQNNTGGTSADYRARLRYVIHQLTSIRKLANGKPFTARDEDAIARVLEVYGIDARAKFQTGFSLPKNFSEGFDDKNIDSVQRAFGDATTLTTANRSELMNFDVQNGQCLVLNALNIEVPIQAEVGEVTGFISRDNDDDLIIFDPAAFQSRTVRLPINIVAYETLKVEFQLVSGAHGDFKAYAAASTKRVGLMTKAKLLEFSSQDYPSNLGLSTAEERIIQEMALQEVARVGNEVVFNT